MKQTVKLPKKIPVFPLSNFIIFPETTVPLNIFEPRYIQMIDDTMKQNKIIGMVQPKETNNGRYLIIISGLCRFKILNELPTNKLYRECEVIYNDFYNDTNNQSEEIKFTDLKLIFKNLKTLFSKQGYKINWKEIEKQSLDQTINTLSMASPFSLEEKQILLESIKLEDRKKKLEEILKTYVYDNFSNNTVQ